MFFLLQTQYSLVDENKALGNYSWENKEKHIEIDQNDKENNEIYGRKVSRNEQSTVTKKW